jgi:lipid A disaccharide synthetase
MLQKKKKKLYIPNEICDNIFSYLPFEKTFYINKHLSERYYDENIHTPEYMANKGYLEILIWLLEEKKKTFCKFLTIKYEML